MAKTCLLYTSLKEENITTERMVYQHITVYEEVGHGGAASIPEGVTEVILSLIHI